MKPNTYSNEAKEETDKKLKKQHEFWKSINMQRKELSKMDKLIDEL